MKCDPGIISQIVLGELEVKQCPVVDIISFGPDIEGRQCLKWLNFVSFSVVDWQIADVVGLVELRLDEERTHLNEEEAVYQKIDQQRAASAQLRPVGFLRPIRQSSRFRSSVLADQEFSTGVWHVFNT